jgi:Zn-dependent M28 family amino/carboxypeptidase
MEGRRTASAGERRAGQFLAEQMTAIGLTPVGDDGYFQRVPLVQLEGNGGRPGRLVRAADTLAPVDAPASMRAEGRNVTGMIRGTDPVLRDEVVLVLAHYDHVGIGRAVEGDSIYNGADDDASGVVAVLEIARLLQEAGGARRTVVFSAMTGEEMGLLGAREYIARPPVPLEHTVAVLVIEMIGRPDSLAGGAGKGWLTGYERSTMGDVLRDNGIPIVADPRPTQNFFRRSDNFAFARIGIPAHTLSSYNLHTDYHRPSDEADAMDFDHMTAVITAAARGVQVLANGERPDWHPGQRP